MTGITLSGAETSTGDPEMKMEYEQVKKRVEKEDQALRKLVIETGIGMLTALLAAVFIFR